jgi:hypothetical protein
MMPHEICCLMTVYSRSEWVSNVVFTLRFAVGMLDRSVDRDLVRAEMAALRQNKTSDVLLSTNPSRIARSIRALHPTRHEFSRQTL